MATKPVKHFLSTMAGAPVLNGTAGSLIAVLDACLVNGFNLLTLDSLSVSGGVLTGAKAGHGFVVDQVIATSANEAALIGEWTITSVTSGTFSADATGVANVTGTGTRTAKAAGAGWVKVPGTNKAAYKSSDPSSTGCYLRVDDTGTTTARVVGYESMSDVDTGLGPYPTTGQVSGGGYFYKSATADSTARPWMIFADSAGFYLSETVTASAYKLHGFFDYTSTKQGDAYRNALFCSTNNAYQNQSGYNAFTSNNFSSSGDAGAFSPRSYTQLGSSVSLVCGALYVGGSGSGGSGGLTYPAGPSNGLIVSDFVIKETALPTLRALSVPGLYSTPQVLPLAHGDKEGNVTGLPGRKLMALALGSSNANEGRVFIDITGPWR